MAAPLLHLTADLRPSLTAALEGRATSRQVNGLVHLAVALASELLSRKWGSRKLQENLGLTGTDLAFDCIGELFSRDEAGRFSQMEAHFGGVDAAAIDDAQLLVLVRRLVYARVQRALFRLYQDVDPAFSRILRNVKLAQDALKLFEERDRFGETYLVPGLCDAREHLPAVEPRALEEELLAACDGTESVPAMLGKLALLLRRQEDHARWVPLMSVVAAIRSVYEIRNRPALPQHVEAEPLAADDAAALVVSACDGVRAAMRESYLGKKKVSPADYDRYFTVIAASLREKLAGMDGEAAPYCDLLQSHIPGLTREEYRRVHRSRLEYLGTLVRKRLATSIRRGM